MDLEKGGIRASFQLSGMIFGERRCEAPGRLQTATKQTFPNLGGRAPKANRDVRKVLNRPSTIGLAALR
jgi:hypothetical protein